MLLGQFCLDNAHSLVPELSMMSKTSWYPPHGTTSSISVATTIVELESQRYSKNSESFMQLWGEIGQSHFKNPSGKYVKALIDSNCISI